MSEVFKKSDAQIAIEAVCQLEAYKMLVCEYLKLIIGYGHHNSCTAGNMFSKPGKEAKDCTCHIRHAKQLLKGNEK